MSSGEKVRASRDGDRFHYYWAARRALGLLDLTGSLEAVGVEGMPPGESVEGEEIIDVAEYHGGRDTASCAEVHYTQLKHSTLRTTDPVVASELRTTLEKFGQIYRNEVQRGRAGKLRFSFVTNRPLNEKVRLSLTELSAGGTSFTHCTEADLLRRYMGFGDDRIREAAFCRRFLVDDAGPGIAATETLLHAELRQHLPGSTGTEMVQLVDSVARKATTLEDPHPLLRGNVLLALRTTEDEIFPAPSAIERPKHVIPTADVARVVRELREGAATKLLVTAVGGVGKSVLTTILADALPKGSELVVYDCFAGGDYRKMTSRRHDHRAALTQISNELAARGRCLPLVATDAPDRSYMHAFMHRVAEASKQLSHEQPGALLTIVIDAADNAALAAAALDQRTVVADLLREDFPANVRLVTLSRPERVTMLDTPSTGVTTLGLHGFGQPETLQHLRTRFPSATAQDGAELHALSGGNPRVQAMALETAHTIAAVLEAIRIAHNTPGPVLSNLLAEQIREVAENGHLRPSELDRLCEALAVLRPTIPLDDLAAITDVPVDAIRSFAVALGRGLHTTATTVQFRDEPTETWFRTTHGPDSTRLRDFVRTVLPLAATSPYVAGTVPQLLFEAELLDDLIKLALSDAALPGGTDELQVREIARSRARFALCATLRRGRNAEAARLALKIGDLSSGHSRTMTILRTHTDLAGRFLDEEAVEALCSGRELATDWPGSNLHIEAALLSHVDRLKDLARNRIRSALDNFRAILETPDDEPPSRHRHVTAEAVADLALAAANIDGPGAGAELLSHLSPDEFAHSAAAVLASRLADAGREDDLTGIVLSGDTKSAVRMAVATAMFDHNITPPAEVAAAFLAALQARTEPFRWTRPLIEQDLDVREVVWTLVHALRHGLTEEADALDILDVHLPLHLPDSAGGRLHRLPLTSILLAHALRARLHGANLTVEAVTSAPLVQLLGREYVNDQNAQEFAANIPGLLPWAECWVTTLLADTPDRVAQDFTTLVHTDLKPVTSHNGTPFVRVNGIGEMATRILSLIPRADLVSAVAAWHESSHLALSRSCVAIARVAARSPHLEAFSLEVVTRAVDAAQRDRTDADSRVESLLALARTVVSVNDTEARTIFEMARGEADRVGDDLYDRWHALSTVATSLATGDEASRAYRLFQISEKLEEVGEINAHALGYRLLHMHEPTYLAALSRARDRRTLDFSAMLSPAVATTTSPGAERLDLLAFHAFRPQIGWQRTVTGLSPPAAALATRVLADFTRFERSPGDVPNQIGTRTRLPRLGGEKPPINPEIRFADGDFTTTAAWDTALFELSWRSEDRRALIRFALNKHPTKRPNVLDALSHATRADQSDFTAAAEAAAAVQPQTPALRQGRQRLVTTLTHRFARSIGTRYDDVSLEPFAEATDTTVTDLSRAALLELGRTAHQLRHRSYFLLAANLAMTLDQEPAGAVFDDLADLFEDLAPSATSSDGPGETLPAPPDDHASDVAGVIWGALGDISIVRRWQAAHAVLLLVRLGCTNELTALARFANGTSSTAPFRDARLPCYPLHARMWLLIALARAAQEPNATPLAVFTTWLVDVVRGPRHAANQLLAQRTLTTLHNGGQLTLSEPEIGTLTQRVVAETVELDHNQQRARPDPLPTNGDRDRYPFFLDFERYWCDDVADTFGSTESNVARRALQVAVELDETGAFAAGVDPRTSAGVYDPRRSYPDRSSWPDEDSYTFYLAVHALLTVGAELAADVPACHEPDYAVDSYTRWITQFLPTRSDGRWLADRRDPPPSPAPERVLADYEPQEHWPSSLRPDDFVAAAGIGDEWVTVHAYTTVAHADLSEDLHIQSALVPHSTARSLLIAMQTSPLGPASYRLPTTDDDHDRPDHYPFDLMPWLNSSTVRHGIDKHDERGSGINFPPTRPGDDLISLFGLTTDDDERTWFRLGEPVLRSRVWVNTAENGHGHETGVRGDQLAVRRDFVTAVLQELDRTLVLQVGLRRDRRRPQYTYQQEDDDDFGWSEWSGKTYLLDPAGRWSEY
ncbi:hypothetical protein [Pseudonocardia kongjuensis]|uniref:hypothetical protein n=1 Tax=Pseudonocardia kongjuensis TaxID=102227 RepID=UPI0031D36DAB